MFASILSIPFHSKPRRPFQTDSLYQTTAYSSMSFFSISSLGATNLCLHPQSLHPDASTTSIACSTSSSSSSLLNFRSSLPYGSRFALTRRNHVFSCRPVVFASSSGPNIDQVVDNSSSSPSNDVQSPSRGPADWEAARMYKETGYLYTGRVEGLNAGGLLIRFFSLSAFLPYPHLSPSHYCKEPQKSIQEIARGLVGSDLSVKVIEVNEENKDLVFSEREAAWSKFSDQINVGDVFEARVGTVEDYGAFVNLRFPDGLYHITGLVHVSEVSWDLVQDVRDILREGDNVKVKVINIDRKRSRLSLSIKQLLDDPLYETIDKVLPQDGSDDPETLDSSENYEIEPLPGLEDIMNELLKENDIINVKIRRQGFERRVVSQDLQLWLSNAPAVNNQFIILARAGRQVQEIQLTTTLDQEGIKKALQRVLGRVP